MSTSRALMTDCILVVDLAEVAESAFAVDPHRRIVYWNPPAEELLGFSADEVMGRTCCEVLRVEGGGGSACAQCLRPSDEHGAGRLMSQFKTQMTARDGQPKQLCVTAVRTHSTEGDVRIMHFLRELHAVAAPQPAPEPQPEPEPERVGQGQVVADDRSDAAAAMPAPHLTDREHEVLGLLAAGRSTSEIAALLSISPITARNHITRIIEKLEVKSRLQAVVTASRQGLL